MNIIIIRLAWQVPSLGHQEWRRHQNTLVPPPASTRPTHRGKVSFSASSQQYQRRLGFPRRHAAMHWGWLSVQSPHQTAPGCWQAWCDWDYQSREDSKWKSEREHNIITYHTFNYGDKFQVIDRKAGNYKLHTGLTSNKHSTETMCACELHFRN